MGFSMYFLCKALYLSRYHAVRHDTADNEAKATSPKNGALKWFQTSHCPQALVHKRTNPERVVRHGDSISYGSA